MFHQDNARPHMSLTTRQKILELAWVVLSHTAYSPAIAPQIFIYIGGHSNIPFDRHKKSYLKDFRGRME